MDWETFVVVLGGLIGAYGGYKRDVLLVGVGVVVLALALVLAWQVAG